jgi:CubicO group peptidase (beta-lactamase class C family)
VQQVWPYSYYANNGICSFGKNRHKKLSLLLFRKEILGDKMNNLTSKVDELFAEYNKPDSAGCSVAIVQNGEVIYQQGYGMANLDHDIAITPDTVFHVASVSKQFTVMAILLLEADGKLSIEDDIRKYLPEIPDYGASITIQHLIYHTSGLRDQWDILSMAGWEYSEDLITNRHVLNLASRQLSLNFLPGEEHLYCNTGYTLMAIIVERLSGMSFRDFTHARIFEPLGMNQTHFHDDHLMIVKKRAMAYIPDAKFGIKICIPTFDTVGATSLFTTALDLAKWEQNYYHHKVGGAMIIEKMKIRGRLNNGKELTYAGGITVEKYKGLPTIGHSGGDAGYRSHFLTFPEQGFGVIVLSNFSKVSPSTLAQAIADLYLADAIAKEAETEAIELSEAEQAEYIGLYFHPIKGTSFRITQKENLLHFEDFLPLSAAAKDQLQLKQFATEFVFGRDAANAIQSVNIRGIGSEDTNIYTRTSTAELAADSLAAYAGIYYSDELLTHYHLVLEDEKLILRHLRNADQVLKPSYADGFKLDYMELRFERDSENCIQGFKLFTGRVRGVLFHRVESASPLHNGK